MRVYFNITKRNRFEESAKSFVLIAFPRKFQTDQSALEFFFYVLIEAENLTEMFEKQKSYLQYCSNETFLLIFIHCVDRDSTRK